VITKPARFRLLRLRRRLSAGSNETRVALSRIWSGVLVPPSIFVEPHRGIALIRHRKKLCLLALFGTLAMAVRARATEPTSDECLSASEQWISLRTAHRLLEARSELVVCASSSCPAEIRDECGAHVEELNTGIPSIAFGAKDASGNMVGAVEVTLDGHPFLDHLDGSSVPVDPGEHTFRFEAPGKPAVERKILIVEGEKDRAESVTFDEPHLAVPDAIGPVPDRGKSHGPTQRILGWTGVGLGVVGVAIGAVFEAQRSSKLSDRDDLCPGGACRVPPATRDRIDTLTNDARSASTVSAVGFVAGGVFAAGGLVLLFTAPKGGPESSRLALSPVAAPSFQGMTVRGAFW
jgi:hypothetical protein